MILGFNKIYEQNSSTRVKERKKKTENKHTKRVILNSIKSNQRRLNSHNIDNSKRFSKNNQSNMKSKFQRIRKQNKTTFIYDVIL